MRKFLITTLLAVTAGTAAASESPLWMRYSRISPDGQKIAFSYKGDIFVVDSKGGTAKQLTTGNSFESAPVWSNDSRTIAYTSDRYGSADIFTIPAEGGVPTRITTHSGNETPLAFTPDDSEIYFSGSIQNPKESLYWPAWMQELYRVNAKGGRPYLVCGSYVCSVDFDKDGKSFIYYDRTGSENIWRKHHTSSVARNLFHYDAVTGKHEQLTDNPGEDREPFYTSDGNIIFLSERNGGSFNIYRSSVDNTEEAVALTSFKDNPVRFLSLAENGTICFGYMGEIYTMKEGGEPEKVAIDIVSDAIEEPVPFNPGRISDFSMSDDGKEIALISRGEVFATSDKYSTTKQITETAAAESDLTVSPDGKSIVYASERSGTWNIYRATVRREGELHFANATLVDEEALFPEDGIERKNPKFSPDGKELAFIESRKYLCVMDLASGKVRRITDGSKHYSTYDSGFEFDWSPDGNWFTLTVITNRRDPYTDIAIVSAKEENGTIHNVTNSAYIDVAPRWAMGGNAIIYISNRLGMRSHASWGSQNDVFIAFMNQETMDRFLMSKEEFDLFSEMEKAAEEKNAAAEKKDAGKKNRKKSDGKAKDTDKDKGITIDFDGIEHRTMRLTPMSSDLASAVLTPDGEKLFFLSAFEGGFDLWKTDTRENRTTLVSKLNGSGSYLTLDRSGNTLYIIGSGISKMSVNGGNPEPVPFRLSMDLDRKAERAYLYDHMFNQVRKMFYRTDYHGVDLDRIQKDYRPFLDHISNNYDFSELLSEILGELNVSHTGSGYFTAGAHEPTADLGVLLDMQYEGDGLLVDEVLMYGTFASSGSKVKEGTIIESIDGHAVKAGEDYFPLLNGKTGKPTLFGLYDPETGKRWEEVAKPISRGQQNEILYNRWVESRKAEVERLSGGRLGYVHIRSMNDGSYRDVYSEILGRYNLKEGIVIDTRYNGGGRLHEDIETLFSGEKYLEQVIRGTVACEMPSRRYNKPSIMIVCEANYSNAHGTPWVYRQKKMGSIVGMPVPGTMTSVYWETMQDPTLYFGVPIIGYRTKDGQYLENSQLEPDFKVMNRYEEASQGRDEQLEVAVRELLRQIDSDPDRWNEDIW